MPSPRTRLSAAGVLRKPVRTLAPYLEPLETLFLIQRIPSWSTNLTARVVSRPKVALLDTGLAARLVHVSAPGAAPTATGQLTGTCSRASSPESSDASWGGPTRMSG